MDVEDMAVAAAVESVAVEDSVQVEAQTGAAVEIAQIEADAAVAIVEAQTEAAVQIAEAESEEYDTEWLRSEFQRLAEGHARLFDQLTAIAETQSAMAALLLSSPNLSPPTPPQPEPGTVEAMAVTPPADADAPPVAEAEAERRRVRRFL